MSEVSYNENIYIVTEKESKKCAQIMLNDNVALCNRYNQNYRDCPFTWNPLDVKNELAAEALKTGFGDWFNQYAASPNAVLIEITPNSAESDIIGEGAPEVYNIDYILKQLQKCCANKEWRYHHGKRDIFGQRYSARSGNACFGSWG